jgi:hypothetical protein
MGEAPQYREGIMTDMGLFRTTIEAEAPDLVVVYGVIEDEAGALKPGALDSVRVNVVVR